jgi:hypothetical protein
MPYINIKKIYGEDTMPISYPYTLSNNKLKSFFEKIQSAAKPDKVTIQWVKDLGFSSSNDRALPRILKGLGFIDDSGHPTPAYDLLKDPNKAKTALAKNIKTLYSDIFNINTAAHKASDEELKGIINRVTGKDQKTVDRYFNTLKALIDIADFKKEPVEDNKITEQPSRINEESIRESVKGDFHYNIQIHLPATTDISVYNAIFKSLKDNLY